jgi:uncharacterized RDD family membrane protein YckC
MRTLIKKRFRAFLIDIAILGALGIFILVVLMIITNKNFLYISSIAAAIIYSLFFCKDVIDGQSIGKRIFKLQIITEDGKAASLRNIIVRNVIVLLQPIDALYMINNRGRRLGDIICKTKVINASQKIKCGYKPLLLSVYIIVVFIITFFFFFAMWTISHIVNG